MSSRGKSRSLIADNYNTRSVNAEMRKPAPLGVFKSMKAAAAEIRGRRRASLDFNEIAESFAVKVDGKRCVHWSDGHGQCANQPDLTTGKPFCKTHAGLHTAHFTVNDALTAYYVDMKAVSIPQKLDAEAKSCSATIGSVFDSLKDLEVSKFKGDLIGATQTPEFTNEYLRKKAVAEGILDLCKLYTSGADFVNGNDNNEWSIWDFLGLN